jgi:hypothetical protein
MLGRGALHDASTLVCLSTLTQPRSHLGSFVPAHVHSRSRSFPARSFALTMRVVGLQHMDDSVGALVSAFEARAMWDNTLLIFSSVGSPHTRVQEGCAHPFHIRSGTGRCAHPCQLHIHVHICTLTVQTTQTSLLRGARCDPRCGAGQRRADLRLRPARQRLHVRAHICAGTALAPAATLCAGTAPAPVRICIGTGLAPVHICAGTGLPHPCHICAGTRRDLRARRNIGSRRLRPCDAWPWRGWACSAACIMAGPLPDCAVHGPLPGLFFARPLSDHLSPAGAGRVRRGMIATPSHHGICCNPTALYVATDRRFATTQRRYGAANNIPLRGGKLSDWEVRISTRGRILSTPPRRNRHRLFRGIGTPSTLPVARSPLRLRRSEYRHADAEEWAHPLPATPRCAWPAPRQRAPGWQAPAELSQQAPRLGPRLARHPLHAPPFPRSVLWGGPASRR